jgi:hypothetical protein
MKKVLVFPLLLLIFLLSFCDKVKNPIVKREEVVDTTKKDTLVLLRYIKKDNAGVVNVKKTLLEDYTGQTCPNCPDAAVVATNLLGVYPGSLIVMAVHGGHFADVTTTYTNNFKTTAGDAWLANFGISTWPIGMINRKAYGTTTIYTARSKWSSAVATANTEPLVISLEVSTNYDTLLRTLDTKVKGNFHAALNSNIQVTAVLTEDEIIGRQTMPNGLMKEDYLFEHLVRGTMPDLWVWGARLKTAPISASADTTRSFPTQLINSKYNDKALSVVVFVHNEATKEVLQVEKVRIR